jgi:hypothetical protein
VLNEVESEAVAVSAYDLCHGTNTATPGLFLASPAACRAAAATFCASEIGTGSIMLTGRVESAAGLNLDCRAGRVEIELVCWKATRHLPRHLHKLYLTSLCIRRLTVGPPLRALRMPCHRRP